MADAVLRVLLQNLSSLIQTEFGLLHGFKEEVEKLSLTLSNVRDVIEDAETRQHTDKAIAVWLRRLKDTAYDAEDVLDEWLTEVRRSELKNSRVIQSFATWFHFNQPVFRHKIAKKIKKIRADFDFIAGEIFKFDLKTRVVERGVLLDPNRETSSLQPEHVFGRDEDQRKIVDMLISDASSPNDVSVLSIVGIGGLGKTTLAQLVYNDNKLSNQFEVRIWVCVAEDFDVKRVLKMIIESLTGKATKLEVLDAIQSHLTTLLNGRRFLLVLDDVWNRDQDKWDKVKLSLTCGGAKGSSILVTTRLEEVGLIMGGLSTVYHLKPLSEDECWYLFKGRVIGMRNEDLSPELVAIGRDIVYKCKGVPLAVKALGTVLCSRKEVSAWLSIRDSEFWELPEEEGGSILGVLRLSYNNLSPQHRQCFSYCSIYPKDYEMKKQELIQLWVANGFVQCIGRMELDDAANQIFNDLLQGSFFQDAQRDDFGSIVKCKMHDLMHDLASSLSLSESCIVDRNKKESSIPKSMRHVSLANVDWPTLSIYKSFCESNKCLRTLFLLTAPIFFYPSVRNLGNFKYLRVLDLKVRYISDLPNSIKHMKCLRYLDLSRTGLRSLPNFVCSLLNLQTLKLVDCKKLGKLPRDMRNMTSLRHLDIGGCIKLTNNMASKMGQMIWLRTLSQFYVSKRSGQQIGELKGLNQLGGKLKIWGLENVKDSREAKEANLINKSKLCSLEMSWNWAWDWAEMIVKEVKSEGVIECLQPHPNLKKLVLVGYIGKLPPSWIKTLLNLVVIKLKDCYKIENFPPLGHLPFLKILKLSGLFKIKYLPGMGRMIQEGMMMKSSLVVLKIEDCTRLTSVSEVLRYLTSLQTLHISYCKELELEKEDFQHLTSLRDLQLWWLPKLTSVPDVTNLKALQSLNLVRANNLKMLPEGLPHLTSLQSFKVYNCHPDLHNRLNRDNGVDWPSISHIPNIDIVSEYNPNLMRATGAGCRTKIPVQNSSAAQEVSGARDHISDQGPWLQIPTHATQLQ